MFNFKEKGRAAKKVRKTFLFNLIIIGVICLKISYKREKIADGIHFNSIRNPSLKTNSIVVNLISPLSEDTASLNASASYILTDSSREYPSLVAISQKLEELYGAGLKGYVSRIGDNQSVAISSSCINDRYTFDKENITEELARVTLGCILEPNLDENGFYAPDFALKKQELLDDIDAVINEKRSYALQRAGKIIYRCEPAAVSVKGERESAEKITAATAYEQYKKLLKTAQIEVFFVGADEPNGIKNSIWESFAKLDREYKGDVKTKYSAVKTSPEEFTDELDVAQCKMVLAFKSNCTNRCALILMNAIFGATPFSKLFLNVREKMSLCYYCSSNYNDMKGVMTVDSGVEKANIEKAKAEIIRQFELMQKGEFDEKEINEARLAVINGLRGVNDSATTLVSWYMSQIFLGTERSPEDEIELLEKVTKEDIVETAKSFRLDTVYVLKGKESAENE